MQHTETTKAMIKSYNNHTPTSLVNQVVSLLVLHISCYIPRICYYGYANGVTQYSL